MNIENKFEELENITIDNNFVRDKITVLKNEVIERLNRTPNPQQSYGKIADFKGFCHRHPAMEKKLGVDDNHVIIDLDHWKQLRHTYYCTKLKGV